MPPFTFTLPGDIFGIFGIISTITIYQQRTHKRQVLWKIIADVFWLIYYFCFKNYSAAAITIVALFRSVVIMNHDKKWAQGNYWMYIFMAFSFILSLFAWSGWLSVLSLLSSLISIFAYWSRDPKLVRYLTVPASLFILLNLLFNGNWIAVLSSGFMFISSVVGIIRLDVIEPRRGRNQTEKNN